MQDKLNFKPKFSPKHNEYMKPKIVVIGSANIDMIVKVPHIPAPGETVLGNEFFTVQGGKGANQAVAASRAGGNVTFIACVGNDEFGIKAKEAYKNEGINTEYIKTVDEAATGVALINVADSGENSISVAPGANSFLSPVDIASLEKVISQADVVLMQLEVPLETIEKAAELANKHKVKVILNPAPAQKLDQRLLEKVAILTPNENEAELIVGAASGTSGGMLLIKALHELGISSVVLTLGEKGAYYSTPDAQKEIAGIRVNAVDTTAAGDTFNGYLAVALASEESMDIAIQIANKAAAISVTRMGAQPSIPFMDEVKIYKPNNK